LKLGAAAYPAIWFFGIVVLAADRSVFERVLGAVSLGILGGGMGMTIAHELSHSNDKLSRFWAELITALLGYPHFSASHLSGHHRSVGTRDDPTTARRGESLYAFVLRSVAGNLRRAWRLEARAAGAASHRSGPRDARTRWVLSLGAALTVTALLGGFWGAAIFALQSSAAIALFESINYVQHYGLERRRDETGRPEPIGPEHAWSSHHVVSNWYLFNLGLHADHHLTSGRPFHELSPRDGSPRLPADYSAMVLLALVPPLFRRVMHARLPTAAGSETAAQPEKLAARA
jgi:alkane 1-monooxygenase